MSLIRLDKLLCDMNIASRREIKKIVSNGRVKLNGMVAASSDIKVNTDTDSVELDGRALIYNEFEYYMLNKPSGYISATQDKKHKTVLDLIDSNRKGLFPIGRLDIDTEGLLFISNDGVLAHHLISPSHHIPKTYFARVRGEFKKNIIEIFKEGIELEENMITMPANLEILSSYSELKEVNLTIYEGKFHQVKRMFLKLGCEVVYLKRIKMGEVALDSSLSPGEYRKLTKEEIRLLRE